MRRRGPFLSGRRSRRWYHTLSKFHQAVFLGRDFLESALDVYASS